MPALFELAARMRRPVVPAVPAWQAALGGLGVESLTVAAIMTVQSAVVLASGQFLIRSRDPVTVVAYAAALLFARGTGRLRGALAAGVLFAALWSSQFWVSIPGQLRFCVAAGRSCDLGVIAFGQVWPIALGTAIGFIAYRAVRTGPPGRSALALGVGVSALAFPIARLGIIPFVGADPTGPSADAVIPWIIGLQIGGAFAAGAIAGRFGRRGAISALVLAVYFVGPWSPQLRVVTDVPSGAGFNLARDWELYAPILHAVASLVGVLLGAMSARRVRAPGLTIPTSVTEPGGNPADRTR